MNSGIKKYGKLTLKTALATASAMSLAIACGGGKPSPEGTAATPPQNQVNNLPPAVNFIAAYVDSSSNNKLIALNVNKEEWFTEESSEDLHILAISKSALIYSKTTSSGPKGSPSGHVHFINHRKQEIIPAVDMNNYDVFRATDSLIAFQSKTSDHLFAYDLSGKKIVDQEAEFFEVSNKMIALSFHKTLTVKDSSGKDLFSVKVNNYKLAGDLVAYKRFSDNHLVVKNSQGQDVFGPIEINVGDVSVKDYMLTSEMIATGEKTAKPNHYNVVLYNSSGKEMQKADDVELDYYNFKISHDLFAYIPDSTQPNNWTVMSLQGEILLPPTELDHLNLTKNLIGYTEGTPARFKVRDRKKDLKMDDEDNDGFYGLSDQFGWTRIKDSHGVNKSVLFDSEGKTIRTLPDHVQVYLAE